MQLNLGKVKGKDGENVFIKYADDICGAGATDSWSPGKKCIGIQTSSDTGYTWAKFVGDNGADGKTCYIKYNTLPQDSGAVPSWSAGQTCIGFKLSEEATAPSTGYTWVKFIDDGMMLKIYPIGAIYQSTASTSPASLFGGTWASFGAGRVLVGSGTSDASYTAGTEGGASKVTLTEGQLAKHAHYTITGEDSNGNGSTHLANQIYGGYISNPGTKGNLIAAGDEKGNNESHNNMPPYIVVHRWRRTA